MQIACQPEIPGTPPLPGIIVVAENPQWNELLATLFVLGMREQVTHQALQRSHVAATMTRKASAFAETFASLTTALMLLCLKMLVER